MDVKTQLWQGIWSLIAIVWGIFAPVIVEKLHPYTEGVKKMFLVLFYCLISALIIIGVKTGFKVDWQSMADVMVIWTMLTAETKATWELFWNKK